MGYIIDIIDYIQFGFIGCYKDMLELNFQWIKYIGLLDDPHISFVHIKLCISERKIGKCESLQIRYKSMHNP